MTDTEQPEAPTASAPVDKPWGMENNTFCLLLHLSQFAGAVIAGAGLILPIVMWAMNKDKHRDVDIHGRIILNWMISFFIYGLISAVLIFVGIGFLMLIALAICSMIFTIVGAVKANNGEFWPYPMSITFFKYDVNA